LGAGFFLSASGRAVGRRSDANHGALRSEIIRALHREWIGNPARAVDNKSIFVAAGREGNRNRPDTGRAGKPELVRSLRPLVEVADDLHAPSARIDENESDEIHRVGTGGGSRHLWSPRGDRGPPHSLPRA